MDSEERAEHVKMKKEELERHVKERGVHFSMRTLALAFQGAKVWSRFLGAPVALMSWFARQSKRERKKLARLPPVSGCTVWVALFGGL